ncbi:MAG: sulfatase-like hydrolase/transferase [Reichenbachiella sp.]
MYQKLLSFWTVLIIILFAFSSNGEDNKRPNVILIMADDLGREAVGCYGGTSYETPVMDRLAATGVQFDHAYAYPLCTNTRVSLMTGKYNFRNWKAFGILDPNEKTFGHLMKDEGYKTCIAGKWQLQSYDPIGFPGADLRRDKGMKVENAGFDEYSLFHVRHTEDKGSRYPDPVIYQNGQYLENTNGQYGPDIFVDFIKGFIQTNKDDPFFVYYPMALPHDPFVPTPLSKEWKDPSLRHKKNNRFFKDMVEYADYSIGKIINQLEELGLRENTLVMVYSDNGTHLTIRSNMGKKVVQGGKGTTLDDGTRVPFIVNCPGIVKKRKSKEFVGPTDFIPFIFDAIGRKLPDDFETDGQSFWADLKGDKGERRDWVYMDYDPKPGFGKDHFVPQRFVKGERYKLYDNGNFYDVENDRLEKSPINPNSSRLKKTKESYKSILDSLRKYPIIGELKSEDPRFHEIVSKNSEIEVIAEGFTWCEGPVWIESEQCLLFSDVPENVIYKWTEMDGLSLFLERTGYSDSKKRKGGKGSNGLAIDDEGKLFICRQGDREIAKLSSSLRVPLPVFETIATSYQGKRFNSPNDLTIDSKGNIYFTDPSFGKGSSTLPKSDIVDVKGVYRLNLDGTIDLLIEDLLEPNGVALSPNEDVLYVANSTPPVWKSYDLNSSELPLKGNVFFDGMDVLTKSISQQRPDGMDVNQNGDIFATGPDGILVFSSKGELLGTIYTGKKTSNCVLSDDEMTLYATCDDYVLRIKLNLP